MDIFKYIILVIMCSFAPLASAQSGPSAQSGLQQTLDENAAAFDLLKQPGHHAILRHTYAPEQADPHETQREGCEGQRNLSLDGERQAVNLGKAFARANLAPDHLLTSLPCRCYYTGVLMDAGPVTKSDLIKPIVNSTAVQAAAQTEALADYLSHLPQNEMAVLITHGYNVVALTGRVPEQGDGYVIKMQNGQAQIVASISSYY